MSRCLICGESGSVDKISYRIPNNLAPHTAPPNFYPRGCPEVNIIGKKRMPRM